MAKKDEDPVARALVNAASGAIGFAVGNAFGPVIVVGAIGYGIVRFFSKK